MVQFDKQFSGSFFRIMGNHKEEFFDSFYEQFMNSSDEIKEKFINTDMVKQKKMLEKSIYSILDFFLQNIISDEMERIAAMHNKKALDIKPHLYDIWVDCLIDTARKYDPEFNEDIELAWRMVISNGVTYMKFKYDK